MHPQIPFLVDNNMEEEEGKQDHPKKKRKAHPCLPPQTTEGRQHHSHGRGGGRMQQNTRRGEEAESRSLLCVVLHLHALRGRCRVSSHPSFVGVVLLSPFLLWRGGAALVGDDVPSASGVVLRSPPPCSVSLPTLFHFGWYSFFPSFF